MVLLATGVVFALSALTYATKSTTGTLQSSQATAYARKILEISLGGGPKSALQGGQVHPAYRVPAWRVLYGADGVPAPLEESDFVSGAAAETRDFVESAKGFEMRLEVLPYRDPVQPALVLSGLYQVDLQIRWRDRLGQRVQRYVGLYREE
jgi:hypothetical protein